MPGPVSTWMGDHLPTGKPSRYVTSHPGQLSLAIRSWVGTVSISKSWGVNRHTTRYTSPVSVVSLCKLVSGWGLRKWRSAPPYGSCGSGRIYFFTFIRLLSLFIHWSDPILFCVCLFAGRLVFPWRTFNIRASTTADAYEWVQLINWKLVCLHCC